MANENKISVNVDITGDGQKQIDKYVKSFESLRSSIIGLSQPFNSFSNNLNNLDKNLSKYTESLANLNTQSKEFISTGDKVDEKVSKASNSFGLWIGILDALKIAIKGWQVALTGGLSIVTAFLPEIINFAKALFTGKDTINQMVVNFKNLNEVMKASNKEAAGEVTRLQILYKSATDVTNTYEDRLKSVKELKTEYPGHLKGLKDEDILNGNTKKTFDELTISIYENARAKAALNKITESANKMLDADFQIEKIRNANFNEKKRYEKEAADGGNAKKALGYYKQESDKRAQIAIAEQESIKQSTQQSIDFLMKFAGGANKISKAIVGEVDDTPETTIDTGSDTAEQRKAALKAARDAAELERRKEEEFRVDSIARIAMLTLTGYEKEVTETNLHFEKLKTEHSQYKATVEQLERERIATLKQINEKFNKDELVKLQGYQTQLKKIAIDNIKDATQHSLAQLKQETKDRVDEMDKQSFSILNNINNLQRQSNELKQQHKDEEAKIIDKAIAHELEMLTASGKIKVGFINQQAKKETDIIQAKADADEQRQQDKLSGNIQTNEENGHHVKALQQQQQLLDMQYKAAMAAAKKTGKDTAAIEIDFAKKKAAVEEQLNNAKIHAGDKYINAVLANTKKDSAIYKAAFLAKKATSIADVIISTKKGIIGSFEGYAHLPFIGQALAIAQAAFIAGQGASSIASIAKQKPGFAAGGQYFSDGRGALLPGYSRTDNTNAYLRSGEAVVVSEAMRNPWARNLVSAINVAHGGRDFSVPHMGRGYAVGGIFTDGGNANRYYNQPMNDVKDLANTLAYQMINNFPPIYVDVKDVNNQQNILAQTVNRVNL